MEDFKDKQIVQRVIDNSLSGIQDDPWMAQRVLNMAHETQGTGGIVVKKKLSIGFILMMAVMLLGVTALAATLLWQDAGEKVAPMESENGYYDTWNTEAKIELIKALYDLGELKDNPDAERVLNSTDMPDAEKNALCDKIMCAYVNGSPDTVTLLSILEKLHGDMNTWSMEDKVWYNNLLNANNMLSAEDTNYVLPETGEFTQEQAVDAAKSFLIGKGAENLDKAQIEATMYEESDDQFYGETQVSKKGRRVWSVVFHLEEEGLPYGGTCHVDIATDGSVIAYSLPALVPMYMTGTLPDATAISEEQAVEIGTNAMSGQLDVPKEKLADAKAFYGYINLADEEAAHAQFGAHVWLINTDQYYVLVSPSGDVIFAGNHDVIK